MAQPFVMITSRKIVDLFLNVAEILLVCFWLTSFGAGAICFPPKTVHMHYCATVERVFILHFLPPEPLTTVMSQKNRMKCSEIVSMFSCSRCTTKMKMQMLCGFAYLLHCAKTFIRVICGLKYHRWGYGRERSVRRDRSGNEVITIPGLNCLNGFSIINLKPKQPLSWISI